MKKRMLIFTVIAIAALSLGITGQAFAQDPDPLVPTDMGKHGNRRSGEGVPQEMKIAMDGLLEEYLHSYYADAIGVDPSALADGNFADIATELGYELTEIREIVKQAHGDALAQALADGVITQEVYDWMSVRGFVVRADGNATGMGLGARPGMNSRNFDGSCLQDGVPQGDCSPRGRGYRGGN